MSTITFKIMVSIYNPFHYVIYCKTHETNGLRWTLPMREMFWRIKNFHFLSYTRQKCLAFQCIETQKRAK